MQDKLFQLIRSLSKNEKRYVKLFASIYKRDTIYLTLFDLLEHQKEYDEATVLKMLRSRGFTGQLHVAKNYLYRLIMKSLRSFHAAASVNAQLKEMLRDVEILYDRGLYSQCEEIVRRAKALAELHDEFQHLFEISVWSRRLLGRKHSIGTGELRRALADLYNDDLRTVEQMRSVTLSRHTSAMLSLFRALPRSPEAVEELRRLMPEEIIHGDERELSSYQAKAQLLHTRMSFLSEIGDLYEHYECARRFLDLVHARPRDSKMIQHHIAALSHLINNLLMSHRYPEAAQALEEMKELADDIEQHPSLITRAHYLVLYHLYSFQHAIELGEFERAFGRIEEIRSDLDFIERHPAPAYVSMLHYFVAVICFGAGRHDTALDWLVRVLNAPAATVEPSIYSSARIFQIVVHLEIGNDDLVDDLIRSCYRYLAKRRQLNAVEETLLRSLRRMARAANPRDRTAVLELLQKSLAEAEKGNDGRQAFEAFDFLSWAESRIEGKSFTEIVARKALRWSSARAA